MTEKKSRTPVGSFIDRHATILTIVAMAILVLVPTKIAYDASGDATDAGDTATHAAHKASNAVARLEDERRQRIYDQNGIDRYFCGKSAAIEKVLTLLLTASLDVESPGELTESQLNARAVFESVLAELSEAPKCEVLIPAPPRPKPGESKKQGTSAETRAENHPEEAAQHLEPPPVPSTSGESGGGTQQKPSPSHGGAGGNSGGSKGHPHKPPAPPSGGGESSTPSGGHESGPTSSSPAQESSGAVTPAETQPETAPAETVPPPEPKSALIPSVVESVEGVVKCLGQLDLNCTLGEVVGQP